MIDRVTSDGGRWKQGRSSVTGGDRLSSSRRPSFLCRLLSGVAKIALIGSLIAIGAALLAYLDVSYRYRQRLFAPETVDQRPVALVLGAGIYPDGQLTPVLADRVRTAADLYHQGKVSKLLMSGDNRFQHYNEPARMGDFARSLDVPAAALAYDYAGRRTYDSCYRTKHIFGQDQVVVVTQAFHLPRALYLCQQLDIDAVGVSADRRPYRGAVWFSLRETLARIRAWIDVHVREPAVVGGEAIDIFSADYTP